jgi:hypothetical protein
MNEPSQTKAIFADDGFSEYYRPFLDGSYDCVDRIVLTAYFPLIQSGGGFRHWWRLLYGSDDTLDNTHVMRFAGHFSRRVRAFAGKKGIPVVDCGQQERKDDLFKKYLPQRTDFHGLFCILVNRAPASVLEVQRYGNGGINIQKKDPWPYVNHYAFHIIDKQWGHIIIRFCPHPPFNAMIILNGHEYVERQARKQDICFSKEDNCFTHIPNAAALAGIADTMRASSSVGRLVDVCERWIYSTCLCFALDRADQEKSNFRYRYSVYQAEYSRNLLFTRGTVLDTVFNGVIERTRTMLDIRSLKTIFGYRHRPHIRNRKGKQPRFEIVVERPVYDLTVFKVHFGRLTVKMYSKGERVLRIEAIVHNTAELRCKKSIENFPGIVDMLAAIVQDFLCKLKCVDVSFIDAQTIESWPRKGVVGKTKTAGIDVNRQRQRAVMQALIALSINPLGITVKALAEKVREIARLDGLQYSVRQAAYDLRKFRGKGIVVKVGHGKKYRVTLDGVRAMAAYCTLRDKVLMPLLAHGGKRIRQHSDTSPVEVHISNIQKEMQSIFHEYGIAA